MARKCNAVLKRSSGSRHPILALFLVSGKAFNLATIAYDVHFGFSYTALTMPKWLPSISRLLTVFVTRVFVSDAPLHQLRGSYGF